MASKASFNATEWELIKDSPDWVYAAMAAGDVKVALTTKAKESKTYSKFLKKYQTSDQLIRDVIEDKGKPSKEIKRATLSDAEEALEQIGKILDKELPRQEADEYREFLLEVGQTVAEAAGEGALGTGKKVSKKESATLEKIVVALKATDADKKARKQAEDAAKAREAAAVKAKQEEEARKKREAEAQAKREANEARKKRDADAKARREADEARKKREAEAKAKREAEEARKKREAEAKAKQEAEEARKEKEAMAQAKRKADEEARKKREADAKVKLEAEEARKEQEAMRNVAKAAPKPEAAGTLSAAAPEYLGEYTVVPGDSLSGIALKYYGSAARDKWMAIYEENKDIIGDNPNLIHPGQVYKIPKLS